MPCDSKPALPDPPRHFVGHGELPPRVRLEPAAKLVGVRLQRDSVVAAARQESPDVQFRESRNPKLAILLDMDEFMEQQRVRKRHVRYHDIAESRSGHLGDVRQVREAHARQHRVEGRVADTDAMQDEDPHRIERLWLEEASHCRPLYCGEGNGLRGETLPLPGDVLGNKAGDLRDLFRLVFGAQFSLTSGLSHSAGVRA